MYECQYPNLLSPLSFGNTILRNRIFAAPTGYCDLTVENIATEPLMAYYESKGTRRLCRRPCGRGIHRLCTRR